MPGNAYAFQMLHSLFGKSRLLDGFSIFLADTLTYLLVFGLFLILWLFASGKRRWLLAAELLLAYIFSRWIVTAWIHFFVHTQRPFEALGFTPPFMPLTESSFPSAHMTSLFALVPVLYALNKRWGLIYGALAFFVGAARIVIGVHWPLDIIGGILIGLVCGILVHGWARPYWRRILRPFTIDAQAEL